MPKDREDLKRITIQVKQTQYDRLHKLIEHGYRRHLLSQMLDMVLDAVEDKGEIMIGVIMAGKYKLVWDDERPNNGTQ